MDRYAYYVCFKCNKAYYGGEARCDAEMGDKYNPQELVCGGCSDIARAKVRLTHDWKLKFNTNNIRGGKNYLIFPISDVSKAWNWLSRVQMSFLLFGGCLLLLWINSFLWHMSRWFPTFDQYSKTKTTEMPGWTKSKATYWRRVPIARQSSTHRGRVRIGLRNLSKCSIFLILKTILNKI